MLGKKNDNSETAGHSWTYAYLQYNSTQLEDWLAMELCRKRLLAASAVHLAEIKTN